MDAIATSITFLLFLSLSSAGTTTRAKTQSPEKIAPGTSLFPNSTPASWSSPSGLFAFGFYPQGSAFIIAIWLAGKENGIDRTVVWTANQDDPPVTSNAKLQLTMDGKLVLTDQQGKQKLVADAKAKASYASMHDSGNFVIYDNNSSNIWQSFDHPTDTILGDQSLLHGCQLFSSSSEINHSARQFRLKMQDDGNLVLYPAYTSDAEWDAYWASGTSGDKYHLYLNKTGILEIRNSTDWIVTNFPDTTDSSLAENIYRATLDSDGIFRLYEHFNNGSFKKVAYWPEEKACKVKSFCGFNSYCTFYDDQEVCRCLQLGFDFIHSNDKTRGCKRNFQKVECKDSIALYNMTTMNNIKWEDRPYSVDGTSQEEECSSACLADCNCWGALYKEGSCEKYSLPFRYVIRTHGDDSESTIAFLKVGNRSLTKWKGSDKPVLEQPPIIKTSNEAIVRIIVITSVFTLLLCSTIAISSHYMFKIRVLKYKRLMETGNLGLNEEVTLRRFSYSELKRATNHFSQELGKGSFGAVYKGTLYKGRRMIAVKRLEKLMEEGEREFHAEMRSIGKTHHRNLVRLLGFCAEGSKRLLVYEYMSNGSLGMLLFAAGRRPVWDERVRIALEVAKGILYLHEECETPIIHCDIKPQNILMDEFWTAKISDFGLAKLLIADQTRTYTEVRGTRGYMAPEWYKNTPISVKTDVYSYGIVLLEILCCRRNIEVNVTVPEEVLLSGWAYKCFAARELNKLVVWEDFDKNVLENMVKVALWCIQDEPALRPTMKSVVLMLEGITDVAIPPCPNS